MAMTDQPRLNLRSFPAGENLRIDAYWRDDHLAKGPCMSLYAGSIEVMRFDLDPEQPHEHWAHGDRERMYYPAGVDPFLLAENSLVNRWDHAITLVGVYGSGENIVEAAADAVAYLR